MTASSAVEQLRGGLLDGGPVEELGPEVELRGLAERGVASTEASVVAVEREVHNGRFLCVLLAVQIVWLAVLGYGALWLFS